MAQTPHLENKCHRNKTGHLWDRIAGENHVFNVNDIELSYLPGVSHALVVNVIQP